MDKRQVKLFKFSDLDNLKKILLKIDPSPIIKKYKNQDTIHFSGDSCHYLSLIIEGEVQIKHHTSDGREIIINTLEQHQMFGEILLFSNKNEYPYDFVATKTNTTIRSISQEKLLMALANEPQLLKAFLYHIAASHTKLNRYIKLISQKTLNKKIAYYLLEYKSITNQNTQAYLVSKTKLADFLGVERPSLVRELSNLRNQGILAYDKQKITVLNLKKLKELI